MKALVVFTGDSDHPLARFLNPGFHHCFCAVLSNGLWLQIDYQRGVPDIRYLTDEAFDLATFYREQGTVVVETEQQDRAVTWPLSVRNCVGLVKTTLCLRTWAQTPYQLYCFLKEA